MYENERCSACGKVFEEGDDVVICHLCDTPHHRACYYELGHCANADRHADGFSYNNDNSGQTAEVSQQESTADADKISGLGDEIEDIISQALDENEKKNALKDLLSQVDFGAVSGGSSRTRCKRCNTEIDRSAPFCYHCGAEQDFPDYTLAPSTAESIFKKNPENEEKIDGKSVSDITSVVKNNYERFIIKFRSGKRTSWNWSGFIFGAYYLFFRKMYKHGAVALAIDLIVNLVVSGIYIEPLAEYGKFYGAFMSLFTSTEQPSNEAVARLMQEMMPVAAQIMPAMLIIIGVKLLIRIVIAVYSDRLYRSRVMSVIDKVDSNLEEGASFNQLLTFEGELNMSQEQMRTAYLGKLGGVSYFAPLIAYAVLNLITSLISKINL